MNNDQEQYTSFQEVLKEHQPHPPKDRPESEMQINSCELISYTRQWENNKRTNTVSGENDNPTRRL